MFHIASLIHISFSSIILGKVWSDCGQLLFFDVFLPTLDVFSDLSLVASWYYDNHYKFATAMSVPLLLNLLFTFRQWWITEEKEDKIWSWLFLITLTWPQWRFLKVIRLLYKKDKNAISERKKLLKSLYCKIIWLLKTALITLLISMQCICIG